MTLAVCPGSFDPLTLGHLDVIERAAQLFDEVVVAIAVNSSKPGLFDHPERARLASASLSHLPGVGVELVPGLLAPWCAKRGAGVIVKGLRSATDLAGEEPMALMNRHLGGPETVFLVSAPHVRHISASLVRDIWRHGGPVSDLVPAPVDRALAQLGGRATMG